MARSGNEWDDVGELVGATKSVATMSVSALSALPIIVERVFVPTLSATTISACESIA